MPGQVNIELIEDGELDQSTWHAIADLAKASHYRYDQYINGPNRKKQAIELFLAAEKKLTKTGINHLAAIAAYEAAVTMSELQRHDEAINAYNRSYLSWLDTKKLDSAVLTLNMKGLSQLNQQDTEAKKTFLQVLD